MSTLRLIKSFDDSRYNQKLVLDFSYRPEKNSADKLYRFQKLKNHSVPYQDFRRLFYAKSKKEGIERAFQVAGLMDYHLIVRGDQIELRFQTTHDSQHACSILFPTDTFILEYLTYPKDVPAEYLDDIAKFLQEHYDRADQEKLGFLRPIILQADIPSHAIKVRVAGQDILPVMEHATKFAALLNVP